MTNKKIWRVCIVYWLIVRPTEVCNHFVLRLLNMFKQPVLLQSKVWYIFFCFFSISFNFKIKWYFILSRRPPPSSTNFHSFSLIRIQKLMFKLCSKHTTTTPSLWKQRSTAMPSLSKGSTKLLADLSTIMLLLGMIAYLRKLIFQIICFVQRFACSENLVIFFYI